MIDKSDFFENVYEVVKLIPKGRASYGAIACYLGKKSSRMVGWALTPTQPYGRSRTSCGK